MTHKTARSLSRIPVSVSLCLSLCLGLALSVSLSMSLCLSLFPPLSLTHSLSSLPLMSLCLSVSLSSPLSLSLTLCLPSLSFSPLLSLLLSFSLSLLCCSLSVSPCLPYLCPLRAQLSKVLMSPLVAERRRRGEKKKPVLVQLDPLLSLQRRAFSLSACLLCLRPSVCLSVCLYIYISFTR